MYHGMTILFHYIHGKSLILMLEKVNGLLSHSYLIIKEKNSVYQFDTLVNPRNTISLSYSLFCK